MLKILTHLFTPQASNNYKAKTLHISSLSIFMIIIMLSQIILSFFSRTIPGVLGISSTITSQEIISLTNEIRQENGLPDLILNQSLVEAAGQKAGDMVAKNYWAHTSPGGVTPWSFFQNVGYKYLYAGENLARDFTNSSSVIEAWMNSPTHRDNILSSRYQDIGIAVVHDTFQGQPTTLIVQMFGTRVINQPPSSKELGKVSESAEAVLAEINETNLPIQEEAIPANLKSKLTFLNSFQLTKAVSISLTLILLAVIVIDSIIITKKKIVRLSGKGLAHLVFLSILLVLLLGIQPGLIL